jgi:hypothetical protein
MCRGLGRNRKAQQQQYSQHVTWRMDAARALRASGEAWFQVRAWGEFA